jgi:hypothetical protein
LGVTENEISRFVVDAAIEVAPVVNFGERRVKAGRTVAIAGLESAPSS